MSLVPVFVGLALVVIVPLGLRLLYLAEDVRAAAFVGACLCGMLGLGRKV